MKFLDHVALVASGKGGFDWTHPSDSLFAGHLQPALCRAQEHIGSAVSQFARLQVPPSIV
jgi:hypothetical protein